MSSEDGLPAVLVMCAFKKTMLFARGVVRWINGNVYDDDILRPECYKHEQSDTNTNGLI